MMRSLILPMMLALATAACRRAAPVELARPAAAARVADLLYGSNLISDPEVNRQVHRYVVAVDRDGGSPDSALRDLQPWLEAWVRRNPDRAARARLMPRPPTARPVRKPRQVATAK